MHLKKKKIAILGAGLAGLSCAYHLLENNTNFEIEIFEKDKQAGGLAKSITRKGFTYDLGPHRFHTKNEDVLLTFRKLFGNNILKRERSSKIYMMNRFFDWPLNLSQALKTMPIQKSIIIGLDYIMARVKARGGDSKDSNYEEWVINRFGKSIYKTFFEDFNKKLWGINPNKISPDWATQRISLANFWHLIKEALSKNKQAKTNISYFFYPKKGGIGVLSQALAKKIKINRGKIFLNTKILSVDSTKKEIEFARNNKIFQQKYDLIVSTIPVTDFAQLIIRPPKEIVESAKKLKFRALIFVCLAVNKRLLTKEHWIYYPQEKEKICFNRISEPKNFSPYNCPKNKISLIVEISCDTSDSFWLNPLLAEKKAINDLIMLKLINHDEIIDVFSIKTSHAYPVYTLDYRKNLDIILAYFKKKGILTSGRNGLFRYNNLDHSIQMGQVIANNIIEKNDRSEITDLIGKVAKESQYFG